LALTIGKCRAKPVNPIPERAPTKNATTLLRDMKTASPSLRGFSCRDG
jgi:hypothetical protein